MANKVIVVCSLIITAFILLAFTASAQRQNGFFDGYRLGYGAKDTACTERELRK